MRSIDRFSVASECRLRGRSDGPVTSDTGAKPPSPREVFVRLVARAFRRQFGIPPENLEWLMGFMLDPQTDHFSYAYGRAQAGMVVVLLTNLRSVFHMETDVDLEERLHYSYFRHDEPEAYYFLKINPIVNELLSLTTTPEPLPISDKKYALIRTAETMQRTQNLEEMQALDLLRRPGNRTVEFIFEGEHLKQAIIKRSEATNTDVEELLARDEYQTITVNIGDREARHIQRAISTMLETNLTEDGRRLPILIRVMGDE
jgi:hypothetical protein